MKSGTRIVLLAGFGTLLILIGFLALSAFRRAERIYAEVASIHETYRQGAAILQEMNSGIYLAGLLVRDYLMDPQQASGIEHRNELLGVRSSLDKLLAELAPLLGQEDAGTVALLGREVNTYWTLLDPVFEWTPEQKAERGLRFLRKQVLPHRQALVSLTQKIDAINAASLGKEGERIRESQAEFRKYLGGIFAVTLFLGVVVAGFSFVNISRLERRSENERRRIEHAEQELRLLSQKLVQAQEAERKSISRELHDEIGQMLTGLRLELRNLQELRMAPGSGFEDHIAESKDLAEKALRSIRDLAMGLRPSMLDDLGLGPALEWQAREFSRRNGIPATVDIDGDLENLPEDLRTCVYRVVQESLTNCARHAKAKNVRVTVHGSKGSLAITVQDDGVGFDAASSHSQGLGLIGMGERVRELGGSVTVSSALNRGTLLDITLPLEREQHHAPDTDPAG